MKTHINNFFSALLTIYLPLLALFGAGGLMVIQQIHSWGLEHLIYGLIYFMLLYLYSHARNKDIKLMFFCTIPGALIAGLGLHFIYGGLGPVFIVTIVFVVNILYIGLLHYKKWV